ncbi:hypothetical protein H5410_007476 [Solanum commersonii]|uniref:Uncharacterized protein n=1 Tax=Solanum commersonii TaxID=4109 RepID=A0A9J6ADM7_SOLCO|nr:hypothetical protein H5410_007476 [Solanum commersonii]
MWPTSNNPIVKPPKIKKFPGRLGKVRRNEADKSRKTKKLNKRGVVMTYSKCGTQRHNKRGCPIRNQAVQATTNNESGRGRGTKRVSSSIGVPTQSHGTATNTETVYGRGRGRGRGIGTGRGAGTCRGRGMPQERNVNEGLGRRK